MLTVDLPWICSWDGFLGIDIAETTMQCPAGHIVHAGCSAILLRVVVHCPACVCLLDVSYGKSWDVHRGRGRAHVTMTLRPRCFTCRGTFSPCQNAVSASRPPYAN